MDINFLKSRWLRLFSEQHSSIASALFQKIVEKYSSEYRSYHNLNHISACLDLFDEVAPYINDSYSLELALWFHDLVYNPERKDNETQSAELAGMMMSELGIQPELIEKVEHLIEITKHPSVAETEDQKYLLDVDLAILGSAPNLYKEYLRQIRTEYAHVSDRDFSTGRVMLLNAFTTSENIFRTTYFAGKYELQARKNIENELAELSSAVCPENGAI